MKVQKMALLGILTAAAIVIATLESFIPSIGIPGVKLGLANIVILIILYELGIVEAVIVNVLRVIVVGLVRGTFLSMGFLMSLTGCALSLGIMIVFYVLIKKFSIIGVSVIGSVFHVTGQIIIAMFFLGTAYIFLYLPVIAISAIITGVFVGIVAKLIIKTGIIKKQREKYNF
ncbi:MAG: Gx transporter family protein [Bacilli bacterium]|nr:Gx transporter family protein [Bacilli bacterium]